MWYEGEEEKIKTKRKKKIAEINPNKSLIKDESK